jgi:hypothetical protein
VVPHDGGIHDSPIRLTPRRAASCNQSWIKANGFCELTTLGAVRLQRPATAGRIAS